MRLLWKTIFETFNQKRFIEKDEYEKERIFLNYGHTFGHAIESITNFKIPHGVAVKMHIANYISFRLNYIKETELMSIKDF